jgi:hypothetical protein
LSCPQCLDPTLCWPHLPAFPTQLPLPSLTLPEDLPPSGSSPVPPPWLLLVCVTQEGLSWGGPGPWGPVQSCLYRAFVDLWSNGEQGQVQVQFQPWMPPCQVRAARSTPQTPGNRFQPLSAHRPPTVQMGTGVCILTNHWVLSHGDVCQPLSFIVLASPHSAQPHTVAGDSEQNTKSGGKREVFCPPGAGSGLYEPTDAGTS